MDVMFPLGKGSIWNDNEIRYSLRSIEKHLSGYDDIYIVGELPDFITGVIHIPFSDEQPSRDANIYAKVLRACQESSISEDFLFFNDDHFLVKDIVAKDFPFFWKGYLIRTASNLRDNNKYRRILLRTYRTLKTLGLSTKNFDTHTPIIYNKYNFSQIMPQFNWTNRLGLAVKSLYANSLKIEGVHESDCKLNGEFTAEEMLQKIEPRTVWSIGNHTLGEDRKATELLKVLNELYPNKSKWEK